MKRITLILSTLFILFSLTTPTITFAKQAVNESIENHDESLNQSHSENSEVHAEEHHTDTSPLFFIIIAVIIGALTRFTFQKSIIPFTVILLLIGIGLGVLGRLNYLDIYEIGSSTIDFTFLDKSIHWAANIDPHLLLYVFLPILIFEAAFAMDVHVFKKTFTNATILAVPGIIVAIVLSALMMVGLNYLGIGVPKWNLTISLLFGAVISATDPVAVVSILKELGASKKLGTLIEGESLLNDGTAIVIFMVIFLGLTGAGVDNSPILEFVRVSFGGIAIGLIVGFIIIKWIKKVFNDALVEISAIVAAAYLTFFMSEHFFAVSGVLALVAFGLVMASAGRTKISPEVQHFLHEFWELAAFIANTLIFLIVGVVIAERTVFTGNDVLILFIIYIGIFIVRAIVMMLFYPAMKRIGYGLDRKDAIVAWYGALRGAIGLALALIVAGSDAIDKEIRDQFLFFTAGIVTLTLLVNATTIKALVNSLGLTKLSPAKILAINNANQYVKQSTEKTISQFKSDRYLRRANWKAVKNFLPEHDNLDIEVKEINAVAESRTRILEKEKSSYWHQFKDGLLGDQAYQILTGDINDVLDSKGVTSLSERGDMENLLKTPAFLTKALNYPIVGKVAKQMFFERLTTSYDCAKGFVNAQEESIKLLESMYRAADDQETKNLKIIEEEINANRIEGLTFLRNLGKEYPEIYGAIATREAIRTMLNYEKHTVERLLKRGRISGSEADKMIQDIESRMKVLRDAPPVFELPDSEELLAEVSWLKDVDHASFHKIAKQFISKVYNAGDVLLTEDKVEDGMFIVVRGNIKITIKDELIDMLGPGNTIGEVAALNDNQRTATVTAESPLTVLWISSNKLKKLVAEYESVGKTIWNITAERYGFYLLRDIAPFDKLSKSQFKKELKKGKVYTIKVNDKLNLIDKTAVIINGSVKDNDSTVNSPTVLSNKIYTVINEAKIFSVDDLS
ncbi:MAG: cation:proton antiporter [Vicingaceae bacterium]|nr:cation:proton antiporter [Vicingaceae bacterium]